jgi:hypothetical protein
VREFRREISTLVFCLIEARSITLLLLGKKWLPTGALCPIAGGGGLRTALT